MSRSISQEALTEELVRRGVIRADAPAVPTPDASRPWFISLVLGVSGWLAGGFALGFVALLFKPDSATGYALCGLLLLGAAYALYALDRKSEFLGQLALAMSIAGQVALTVAATQAFDSHATTAALVMVMQIVLVLLMPNDLAKVLSSFFAAIAWALTVRFAWWGEHFSYGERELLELTPALLAWFVVWAPVMLIVRVLVTNEPGWMAAGARSILRPALSGLLVSLCVGTWVSEPLVALEFWANGAGRTNWVSLWPLLGAGCALFAAYHAFRLRSYALVGTAVVGALLHVSQFYYVLGTTLLLKSAIMTGDGVVALLVALWLRRQDSTEGNA
jgi:hypothetical protein